MRLAETIAGGSEVILEPCGVPPPPKRFLVLGAMNSGTNFVDQCLVLNQFQPGSEPLRIDFFKHYPAPVLEWMAGMRGDSEEMTGVHWVVVLRDPVSWLVAMQKAMYEIERADRTGRVVWSLMSSNHGVTYQERFRDAKVPEDVQKKAFAFSSLLDVWEKLYCGWIEWLERRQCSFSIVRYEEFLESPAESLHKLGIATNHQLPDVMQIPLVPSKEHGYPCGYVEAREKWLKSRRKKSQGVKLSFTEKRRVTALRKKFGYMDGR